MGVDVGGRRKAFDVAVVEGRSLIGLRERQSVDDVVAWVASVKPSVVAIDSPRSAPRPAGPTGRRKRMSAMRSAASGGRPRAPNSKAIPTTSGSSRDCVSMTRSRPSRSKWSSASPRPPGRAGTGRATVAAGPRGRAKRSPRSNSRGGVTNQDKRDAIAAALTARDYDHDCFDAFGDIIVPHPA
jgi:hypothetical protein